jgi:hypothetical protein
MSVWFNFENYWDGIKMLKILLVSLKLKFIYRKLYLFIIK